MQHNRKMRYTSAFLILGIATLVLVILNVCIGTVEIPFCDILTSIGGYSVENERILWDIRMPRTLAALLLGGFFTIRSRARLCLESHPGRRWL